MGTHAVGARVQPTTSGCPVPAEGGRHSPGGEPHCFPGTSPPLTRGPSPGPQLSLLRSGLVFADSVGSPLFLDPGLALGPLTARGALASGLRWAPAPKPAPQSLQPLPCASPAELRAGPAGRRLQGGAVGAGRRAALQGPVHRQLPHRGDPRRPRAVLGPEDKRVRAADAGLQGEGRRAWGPLGMVGAPTPRSGPSGS